MTKGLTLTLLLLMIPVGAAAQDTSGSSATTDDAGAVQTRPTPPRPPIPAPLPARRHGSMVGYIDDSTVTSRVRVRWESGFDDNAPDRAEFFYAKCGCYAGLPTNNAAFDPDAPGPQPGVVDNLNFQQLYVEGEYSGHGRAAVFAELPLRWIQPQHFVGGGTGFGNQSGLGDVRAGVKLAMVDTETSTATLQIRGLFATGKAENGLGTHHQTIEPSLLLYNAVSDRAAIESQIGLWQPLGGSKPRPDAEGAKFSGPVFFYGIGPSFEAYRSGDVRVSPVVELMGWHVIRGSQTVDTGAGLKGDAAGTNIVNLKIGARIGWTAGDSVYFGWGHALSTASWYDNIVRFEYRRSF